MEGAYLKRAAVLLFHPESERFITGAYVKIGYFETNVDLRYQDEVHGDLFKRVWAGQPRTPGPDATSGPGDSSSYIICRCLNPTHPRHHCLREPKPLHETLRPLSPSEWSRNDPTNHDRRHDVRRG
jgi:hypothetical protein